MRPAGVAPADGHGQADPGPDVGPQGQDDRQDRLGKQARLAFVAPIRLAARRKVRSALKETSTKGGTERRSHANVVESPGGRRICSMGEVSRERPFAKHAFRMPPVHLGLSLATHD